MHLRAWLRKQQQRLGRRSADKRFRTRRQSWRRLEQLEPRLVLDGPGIADYGQVTPAWFGTVPQIYTGVDAVTSSSLTGGSDSSPTDNGWPRWIVRLIADDAGQANSPRDAEPALNAGTVDFQVIRGLGLPGQVLVRAFATAAESRAALAGNPHVASFQADGLVEAQVLPDDPDFPALIGLHNEGQLGATEKADIDAPQAWDIATGSPNVVVGVIDSGIDVTHPDLYLNIWINQGEIPTALKAQLTDGDADRRITFYDLNDPVNAAWVRDSNGNAYIDAEDLLADPGWADGLDTDHNSFVDDFFGWNFRSTADEPYAPNDPRDVLGHGTHVAGTIGAIGNNGRGVTGVNWRSSLMSLKFLDDGNQGQLSNAVAAVNYASMMRTEGGENVRVLNASWGQSGSALPALQTAIEGAGAAGILFAAAAGNGNILGQGINLDREPFYPASYGGADSQSAGSGRVGDPSHLSNVIAVAATGPHDELASFSNFGAATVDVAAPGIGVLSTLPGGRYGTANGTSMAAPHVAGVAALLWSEEPDATVAEVREALLSSVDPLSDLHGLTVTGGRLNAFQALNSTAFAPRAELVSAVNISMAGGADQAITVRYTDRHGIDTASLSADDLEVTRHWGPKSPLPVTLVPGSIIANSQATEVTVTYRLAAPGGDWDVADFGRYTISVVDWRVRGQNGLCVPAASIGEFLVRIADPSVFYVDTFADGLDAQVGDGNAADVAGKATLRAAIQEANAAAPASRTIVLGTGIYTLSLPPVPDATVSFPTVAKGGTPLDAPAPWSNETSGDLDVTGHVTIIGDTSNTSTIDAAGGDRVFKVHPGAALTLKRTGITGGMAPHGQDGGGILTAGTLELDTSLVAHNAAWGAGGGVAIWGGTTHISQSTIADNQAFGQGGGGLLVCNGAALAVDASTLARNTAGNGGGGLLSLFGGLAQVTNSTLSGNESGYQPGAAVLGNSPGGAGAVSPSLSGDGQVVAFASDASDLVPGDTNGSTDVFVYDRQAQTVARASVADGGAQRHSTSDSPSLSADGRFVAYVSDEFNPMLATWIRGVFVYDRQLRIVQCVSVADDGTSGDGGSGAPALSADGRFVTFFSSASNLVPGDTNGEQDVFVYDRQDQTIQRVSVADDGTQGNRGSDYPALSADGRFVAFKSWASNLVPDDTNGYYDVFVYDREQRTIERVSVADDGTAGNEQSTFYEAPSLSADGRFVGFSSYASNLVLDDTNGCYDVFVYDRGQRAIERVSVTDNGGQRYASGNSPSLSGDGRRVAFVSYEPYLWGVWTKDVFVYDRQTQALELVSVADDGTPGNGDSFAPSLSADGGRVAFASDASNLVIGDTNDTTDVLVYDRQQRTTTSATILLDVNPVMLESVTVAENAGADAVAGWVETHNSLYARTTIRGGGSANGLGTGVASRGYNVIPVSNDTRFPYDLTSEGSLWLGPLQDNGGPTWTHALLYVNPATDAADPWSSPVADQRGIDRPQDGDGLRGSRGDIGAFEAFQGNISGVVFQDLDRDGQRDPNEPGLANQVVFVDENQNGNYDRGEPADTTRADDPGTAAVVEQGEYSLALDPGSASVVTPPPWEWSHTFGGPEQVSVAADGTSANGWSDTSSLSADGRFVAFASEASNLVPDDMNGVSDVFVFDRQRQAVELVSVATSGLPGNAGSYAPSLSADGRYVAFFSSASNLVFGDTNGLQDVFVYDRQEQTLERVSVSDDGTQGNRESDYPALSADGRFVAFKSWASNLVPGDTNGYYDVFVYDRELRIVERVSVADDGSQGNEQSGFYDAPSLSADGRFVAFESNASNLVPEDANGVADMFVYDRQQQTVERVSVADDGAPANGASSMPSLSADGRFVAFASYASNLVPGDTNGTCDVFVYDRQEQTAAGQRVARVDVADGGMQGDSDSYWPSLSADGRFVAFGSYASNLVPGDTNGTWDAFVYDRQQRTIERVSVADDGTQGNGGSYVPSLSAAGRFVAFASWAANLAPGDTNDGTDVLVTLNRQSPNAAARTVGLFAGQVLAHVDLGLAPDAGEIRGRCFQDGIANGVYDPGEAVQQGWTVFLDANANGQRDSGELTTQTDADGNYAFTNLPSVQAYRVSLVLPSGYAIVLPTADSLGVWKFFLAAGGRVTDRDFGVRLVQTAGQSENGAVQGSVFVDRNGNGWQDSEESGIAGKTVFLDLNDDGLRQFNEPQQFTDERGQYAFANLGNRPYAVRVLDLPHYVQTAPVGNSFAKRVYSLATPGSPLGSPQDVAVGDLNGDGSPDLATAIFDRNAVTLLLNDGYGNFATTPIEISLEPQGYGPVAVLAGDFDGRGGSDLAVVNSLSSKLAILLDFDGTRFASVQYVAVGAMPNAVASGDLDGDGDLDLIVTNEADNNLSIVRNDGHGVLIADAARLPVGQHPFDVVAGDFNEDHRLDLAVADFGTNPQGSDLGDVQFLLADGHGSFWPAQLACQVGFGPAALVAADLNGDQHLDLAVANFLSDNVTVCQGAGNGTFQAVATLSGGQGPMDLEVADLERDGDLDLLVTNGKSKTVGILRNRLSQDGDLGFEPAETFGRADIPDASRISVAAEDLDHNGTPDLAVVNSQQNSITVNLNAIVGGAQRLALTGVQTVQGVNFSFRPVNTPPTLNGPADPPAIHEDAREQRVALSGISAGVGDTQPLQVTASSDHPGLIAMVTVDYTSPAMTGTLRFTPLPDQSGRAVLTVIVTDGGLDGDLSTAADNGTVSRTFTVTVLPVNDPPALDPLAASVLVGPDFPAQTVPLTGITSGRGESQPIEVTAATSDPSWIKDMAVAFSGTGSAAALTFRPLALANAFALITVTVTDGGFDGDLSTAGDNLSCSRTLAILSGSNVDPLPAVTIDQASGQGDPTNVVPVRFHVVFSKAVSGFAAEDVTLGGTAPGTLVAAVSGSGTTYEVEVSGMTNTGTVIASLAAGVAQTAAGQPNQASVSTDNQITYAPWHNAAQPCDLDGNGRVEALDVLTLINYINAHPGQIGLPAPPAGAHPLFDTDYSGGCSASDALLAINYINSHLQGETAEGEAPAVAVATRIGARPAAVRWSELLVAEWDELWTDLAGDVDRVWQVRTIPDDAPARIS